LTTNIQITEDGSHTLYSEQFDEHYHSIHGAIQESMHVYINAGLKHCELTKINVFEVGFGSGLNALLTCIEASKLNLDITYYSIELYPIKKSIIDNLNYVELTSDDKYIFSAIHTASWNKIVEITSNFRIVKIIGDLNNYNFTENFDVIYFDAFSPDKQPYLWTEEVFKKLYDYLNLKGIITTYCSKGIVKRALRSAGFIVKRLPGPPGKWEMLRAIK